MKTIVAFVFASLLAASGQPIRILDNVPYSLIDSNSFDPEWYVANTLKVTTQTFTTNDCVVSECGQLGTRRLLKFGLAIVNVSGTNWVGPAIADHPELFERDPCHEHLHLLNWTTFKLFHRGKHVATSGKLGWCIRSGTPVLIGAAPYSAHVGHCGEPALLPGWSDYYANVPCMWVDVTGLKDGVYSLVMAIDPTGVFGTPDTYILPIRLTATNAVAITKKGKGNRQ